MNLQDFKLAVGKLCLDPLCEPLTLFLQGGLSVTGTWEWLLNPDGERVPSAIIVEARDGVRTVVPVETITALREHRGPTKSAEFNAELFRKGYPKTPLKNGPPPRSALTGRKPGFVVFDEVG